ncbi:MULTISPECIES: DUF2442 domain-containing protein [Paraburkholderia]|uniref:DUF2442 domain-containing protein n=1 Tax=Paraburkholderia TaxID=1822464 RepID=UPI0019551246|nr:MULTISPECIES: DUF2442 domain-containing protein [Paraburkholderia]MDH6149544.1 hypothetical protein [Paraburkholderia sp. WSM4179]
MISHIRPIAIEVIVDESNLTVLLKHGCRVRLPLRLFPKLWVAAPEQRSDVRISASGAGLRWDQLDEDIRVSALLHDAERRHRDERLTSCVPIDFPSNPTPALLSGTQPKLAGRIIDGRFVVGLTAEERWVRWDMCEDLAQQLVPKTLQDAAKFPQNSHDVTLRRMRRAIVGKNWTGGAETDWLMQRLRVLLGW